MCAGQFHSAIFYEFIFLCVAKISVVLFFFYSSLRTEDVQNAHTNVNEIKKTQHHQVSMRLHVICIR